MNNKILNKSNLQFIAVLSMAIDHSAVFMPDIYLYYLCKFIGRTTIVIMCYFIAEGFYKTHSLKGYIKRLAVFAAISQIPFYLYSLASLPESFLSFVKGNFYHVNVIFTLLVGLCLLAVMKSRCKSLIKIIAVIVSVMVTRHSDWGWFAVFLTVSFGIFRNKFKWQVICFVILITMRITLNNTDIIKNIADGYVYINDLLNIFVHCGAYLALPLLYMYNGKRGTAARYGLYIFYPLHLSVLYVLEVILL